VSVFPSCPFSVGTGRTDGGRKASFFNSTLEELKARGPQCQSEVAFYLDVLERQLGVTFADGYEPSVECIRQTLTPVICEHRPLVFYVIIVLLQLVASALFHAIGFRRRRLSVPGRTPTFAYWYRPGQEASHDDAAAAAGRAPIVLFSGLGGLAGMVHFVYHLAFKMRRPLFLVGNPYVSLRLCSTGLIRSWKRDHLDGESDGHVVGQDDGLGWWEALKRPEAGWESNVLGVDEVARSVRRMLFLHGFVSESERPSKSAAAAGGEEKRERAGVVLVSHSLGTGLASYLCRVDPDLVAGNVLVDPISLLLHNGALVRNFLYTTPRTVGQRLINLVGRELGIAQ
jgi:hypothetical protein